MAAAAATGAGGEGEGAGEALKQPSNRESILVPVMNESWFGKPVEEVDPMIFEDTFCVISKKFDRKCIYRYSCSKSLLIFGPLNPVRRFSIYLTTHRWFDLIMIITILCNCITLAMITNEYDPNTDEKIVPKYETIIDHIESGFLGIYLFELILKVVAKGLVLNRFSYMRNRWNLLDFTVVTFGVITFVIDLHKGDPTSDDNSVDLDFLRTFRVLRVFKTISILPGLRMMINALLSAVVQLVEVMALTFVCLMIFSLFALELFQGRLRQKCVADKGGPMDRDRLTNRRIEDEPADERDRIWTAWVNNWENWERREFPEDEPVFCGNGSDRRSCSEGYTCIGNLGHNPDKAWTSFDRFYNSLLSTFQLLTLDYWERLYDIVVSTCGVWSLLFFLLVIFLGSYYLLNLMLAVVALSYDNSTSAQDHGPLSAEEKLAMNRRQSNFSFDDLAQINVCKMNLYKKRTKSERERLTKRATSKDSREQDDEDSADPELHKRSVGRLDDLILSLVGVRMALAQDTEKEDSDERSLSLDKDMELQSSGLTARMEGSGSKSAVNAEGQGGQSKVELNLETKQVSRSKKPSKLSICLATYLRPYVTHSVFDIFIMVCIVGNTIVLSLEYHGETKELQAGLKWANLAFMVIFSVECLLKIAALQKEYFQTGWNIFDLIVVLVNFIEMIVVEIIPEGEKGTGGLSVIRSFRLLRVFKLAQSWVTMKVLLNIIFSSFGALANLICVLLMVIYIFAVMGMQLVGEHYKPSAFEALTTQNPMDFPVWHWRHFWYAFMMVFRVLCGEWIEPLWDCLQAGERTSEGNHRFVPYFKCMIIYLMILVVGNFIMLNLFLALLLNSFDTEELNAQREKELEAKAKTEQLKNIVGLLMHTHSADAADDDDNNEPAQSNWTMNTTKTTPGQDVQKSATPSETYRSRKRMSIRRKTVFGGKSAGKRRFIRIVKRVMLEIQIQTARVAVNRMENRRKRKIPGLPEANKLILGNPAVKDPERGYEYEQTPEDSDASEVASAGACCPHKVWKCRCPCKPNRRRVTDGAPQSWENFRDVCVKVVSHPVFEYAILLLIFASSITLCFEDIHLDEKPGLRQALCYVNYGFTLIFCLEMLLKWVAIGIWGYFTSFWTVLDAFIVIVSLTSMYFDVAFDTCSGTSARQGTATKVGALKALRTLRALRPLRAISRWQGMKIVVNALVHAIPSIANVLLVCLLFWLIFSIMAVQFFKGQFYRCVDKEGEMLSAAIVPNKEVCCAKAITHKYSWTNTISNYDNVLEGFLSLLQIATFEGWIELMGYSVDAVGVDKQPVRDNQIAYYLFYVIFIVFGSFFSLQLFIGVIIDNFNMLKKKYDGNMLEMLLTPSQRNYYIAMKNVGKLKPKQIIPRPRNSYLGVFYGIAMSSKLEVFIFLMIFLNMVQEGFQNDKMMDPLADLMGGFSIFFTIVYALEAIIKIIGLGTFYFTVPWNLYDFILVLASILHILVEGTITLPVPPTMLRVVRVVRIGKILRLVKAAKGIRKLMYALVVSLPALFNIGALLSLITFIYAILGMNLFGRAPKKWSVDDLFNFDTFLNSCLMLLRLMTAAGWNEVMDSLTPIEPLCGTYRHIKCGLTNEPECPNRGFVITYIVSYLILTYFIVINLYIAIILENYVDACNEEDVGIVEDDLQMFYIRWSYYDPRGTQFIDFDSLPEFLENLNPPFQFKQPNTVAIAAFNLPIGRGNKLHCLDVLRALIGWVLGEVDHSEEFRKLQNQMELKFQKQFPTRRFLDIVSSSRRWKIEQNAAIIIQRAWRAYVARKYPTRELKSFKVRHSAIKVPVRIGDHGGIGHMMSRIGNILKANMNSHPEQQRPDPYQIRKSKKDKTANPISKKAN